jgi:DNA-binding CsgD family transcriptional regulator
LLRAYFPLWRESARLPAELCEWVRVWLRRWDGTAPAADLGSFVAQSPRGRLLVRCFPPAPGAHVELRLTEVPAEPNFLQLRADGLTVRECEVLHWIAQGNRDAEIADILGAAPRTVGKHIEHILAKLGVENRAAAVEAALEKLRGLTA